MISDRGVPCLPCGRDLTPATMYQACHATAKASDKEADRKILAVSPPRLSRRTAQPCAPSRVVAPRKFAFYFMSDEITKHRHRTHMRTRHVPPYRYTHTYSHTHTQHQQTLLMRALLDKEWRLRAVKYYSDHKHDEMRKEHGSLLAALRCLGRSTNHAAIGRSGQRWFGLGTGTKFGGQGEPNLTQCRW
jgi:hypothetical protein